MPDETNPKDAEIVQFVSHAEQERNRRIMVEAARLAGLAPGEWKLWLERSAATLQIEPDTLADLVKAQIKHREQQAADQRKADRLLEDCAKEKRLAERDRKREQQRIDEAAEKKAKEKAKAFADIKKLSSDLHQSKIDELAKRLEEDPAALKAEFDEICASEVASSMSVSEWDAEEPWQEPVTTAALLDDIIARFNAHARIRTHDGTLIIALWVLFSWVHDELAHHSPYLGAISPRDDSGKTTWMVEVLGRLAFKPWLSGSHPTLSTIFRVADREKSTQFFDNVDKLFESDHEVVDLFLNGWTRGVKYIRNEKIGREWVPVAYDPFCPKCFTLTGTVMPCPLLGRSLLIESWPLKLGDSVVEVDPFNDELMEAFKTLRRKTKRWKQDHLEALKGAQPLFPAGFTTRPRANAKLLLAIAELAGEAYAERARAALAKLLRDKEPSWLELLLQELWTAFVTEHREWITSDQLVARLNGDPISVWREYARGNRIGHKVTQREIAALLKTLHIRPVLVGKARKGGYRAQHFFENEIFQHFLHRDPLILSPDTETEKKTSKRSRRKKKSGARIMKKRRHK